MALEPKTGTVGTEWEKHVELCDMTKRFWIGAAPTMPVVLVGEHYWRQRMSGRGFCNGMKAWGTTQSTDI